MILNRNYRWQHFASNLAANALLSLAGNRNYQMKTCLLIDNKIEGDNKRRRREEEERSKRRREEEKERRRGEEE